MRYLVEGTGRVFDTRTSESFGLEEAVLRLEAAEEDLLDAEERAEALEDRLAELEDRGV